jgi:diaminopimelate decarboxylase
MGIGVGHHEKVVTAGHNTKFGINPEYLDEVRGILQKYRLKLTGVNQHIGSLFLQDDAYIKSARALLSITQILAETFEDLELVDMGGGFGIPYHKQDGQARLDLRGMGAKMDVFMRDFSHQLGKEILFLIEPGRYIAAECGVLLGTVHAVKNNGSTKYIGTDIGMNVLARPSLYDAHHDIEIYHAGTDLPLADEKVTVVGNICESGDILAKDRTLPVICEQDVVGVLDAGAYGHVMSSNYNSRLRTAEILLRENGTIELIRRRDTFDDLLRSYPNDVNV